MGVRIDPASLSTEQARAYLAIEASSLERAEFGAALSKGAQRRRYVSYAQRHKANMMALADIVYPIDPELAAMSDAELLAALEA